MSIHLKNLLPGMLGEATLIVGDPGRVALIGTLLENVRQITDSREFQVIGGSYRGIPVSVCSTGIGSGSTEIAVTELIENGAKRIVRCGGCGAWQDGINVGDIILNSAMARSAGLMSSYVEDSFPAVADPILLGEINTQMKQHDMVTHIGIGLTSEGYYAGQFRDPQTETGKLFTRGGGMGYYRDRGILNCEMETAILFILGSLYRIPVANSLVVHVTRKNNFWANDEDYRRLHLASARAVLEAIHAVCA